MAKDLKSFVNELKAFVDVPKNKRWQKPSAPQAFPPQIHVGDIIEFNRSRHRIAAISGNVITLEDGGTITFA
jgi:hypothetical protein